MQCAVGFMCQQASCVDIDECAEEVCGNEQICQNTIGSYTCKQPDPCTTAPCDAGYKCVRDDASEYGFTCNDIDECQSVAEQCGQGYKCNNILGSFECVDLDECREQLGERIFWFYCK